MQILKWLLVNWDSVLLIAMVVALIIYLIKTGQTKILKQIKSKEAFNRVLETVTAWTSITKRMFKFKFAFKSDNL